MASLGIIFYSCSAAALSHLGWRPVYNNMLDDTVCPTVSNEDCRRDDSTYLAVHVAEEKGLCLGSFQCYAEPTPIARQASCSVSAM